MKHTDIKLLLLLLIWFFAPLVKAQNDVSIHLLKSVPQSTYTNPAFMTDAQTYIGFPVLSSVYFDIKHSGFSYSDIITRRDDDSLYLNIDNTISKLQNRNYLSTNFNIELLAFGFKINNNYFNFSATEKVSTRFSYPKDLIKFAWGGNTQFIGQPADFSGIGFNFMYYREYAVGMSRKFMDDNLNVGLRSKLLFGISNIWTEKSHLTLSTDPESFALTAQSDIIINTSLPEVLFDDNDSIDFDVNDFLLGHKNRGMAFDVGVSYRFNDKFSVAASVLDIGKIKWSHAPKNFITEKSSFTFEGIQIILDDEGDDGVDNLLDSINDTFGFKEMEQAYETWLPAVVYLSGAYNLNPNNVVAFLVRADVFDKRIYPSYTFSFNKRFGNIFNAVASYSIMNRSYNNMGLGFSLQLGAFQLYALNDNLLGLIRPTSAKNTGLRFGINFLFNYKQKEVKTPQVY